jgi:hypothetical protein
MAESCSGSQKGRWVWNWVLVALWMPTLAGPVILQGNAPAAAGGDATRGWLLGVLTCLCLGILGAAGVGGVLFLRSRRKPDLLPAPVPIISQPPSPPASKPREAIPVPQATTLPTARLVVLQGLVDHRQFVLTSQTLTIGRDVSNSLVVNDSIASRHHARIEPVDNAWVIFDTDSVNGTLINGKSVSHHVLSAGDRIEIGTAVLEFQLI